MDRETDTSNVQTSAYSALLCARAESEEAAYEEWKKCDNGILDVLEEVRVKRAGGAAFDKAVEFFTKESE